MSEKDVLTDLQQIDGLLARCINPALTRAEHDAIRQAISVIAQRIKLSYKLEDEKRVAGEAKKAEADKSEIINKDKGEA